jgi:excisionase family DNA binding protein
MKEKKLMQEEKFLSTRAIAERLNVHQRTVIRWITAGELKATKYSNRYFVNIDDYRSFICETVLKKGKGNKTCMKKIR